MGAHHGGGVSQLIAQLFEAVSIAVVVFGLSYVVFQILNGMKLLRSEPAHEIIGLDIPEMGARGYWQGSHPNIKTLI